MRSISWTIRSRDRFTRRTLAGRASREKPSSFATHRSGRLPAPASAERFFPNRSTAHVVGEKEHARLRETQGFFSARADAYRASASHGNADDLARMIQLLRPQAGGLALDVATGGGHTARALRQAGCRVLAADATRAMLAGATRAPDAAADAAVMADAHALPVRDGALSIVASRIAPHHFGDLRAFVSEAARVLAPGGKLYVFDLTSPEDAEAARIVNRIETLRDPSHAWSHTPSAWRDALDAAGLRTQRLERTASEFDLEPWLARAAMPPEREREARALLAAHPPVRLEGYGISAPGRMRVLRVELLATR